MFKWSTSTSAVGAPEFEGVSSPLINFNGTVEVFLKITWGMSSTAWTPVRLVDLPKSDIESSVSVVKHGVWVSSTFVWNDTFATSLVPAVFGTPSTNISHIFGSTTWTAWASATWAVTTARISQSEGEDQGDKNNKLHNFKLLFWLWRYFIF